MLRRDYPVPITAELTMKVLLLVFRNWRRKKAKRRKKDRKLKKNAEKEKGNGSVNEKGGNVKERGSVNERRRRNESVNESEIGIVTELRTETETEIVTEIVKEVQIATRIGADQGKCTRVAIYFSFSWCCLLSACSSADQLPFRREWPL